MSILALVDIVKLRRKFEWATWISIYQRGAFNDFTIQNDWTILYSDDPTKPKTEWEKIASNGASLTNVAAPAMEEGSTYYLIVDNSDKGIQTPIITIRTAS